MRIEGSCAVITGGASGIGAGLAEVLAAQGAHVHLLDRDEAGAVAMADALRRSGAAASAEAVDVTDADALLRIVESFPEGQTIDLLFVNAGVIALKPFLETRTDDWRWIMDVNLMGTVATVRAFLPRMLAQATPSRIVVTNSMVTIRGPRMRGQTLYAASKAAQLGFCEGLRTELAGSPVGLSVVFPSAVETKLKQRSEAARPGVIRLDVPAAVVASAMSACEAGRSIVKGVAADQPYITTHPAQGVAVRDAQAEILRAFATD